MLDTEREDEEPRGNEAKGMQKRKGVTSQEEGWLVGDQADDPDINSARWRANVVVKGGVELDERPQSTTTVRSRRPEAEG